MQNISKTNNLPPGQQVRQDFPRFGLTPYAKRYQKDFGKLELKIGGNCIKSEFDVTTTHLEELHRVALTADFHCVTTWTVQDLAWSGFRFKDFAYLTDVKTIEDKEVEKLKNLEVLVVNALRIEPHISHFNLEEALQFVSVINPKTVAIP